MTLILLLALPLALGAAALTKMAVGAPERRTVRQAERREQRDAERAEQQQRDEAAEAARLAAATPTIRSVLERDGLVAAVDFAVHLARSATRARRRDAEPIRDAETQVRAEYAESGQALVEAHRSLPRRIATYGLAGLFVVSVVLLFVLVRGVLRALLGASDLVAVPLAIVDIVLIAVLGLFLHEAVRPTGVFPEWKDKTLRDRAPMVAALSVLLGAFLVVQALLAPARADVLHRGPVAQADQACEAARAAEAVPTPAGSAAPPSSVVACDRAATMRETMERAHLWDQTAAVALPVVEIVTAAFALEAVALILAQRMRRRAEEADARVTAIEREIDAIPDRYIDQLTEEAVRAGFTAEQVEAELAAQGVQRPAPADPDADADDPGPDTPADDDARAPEDAADGPGQADQHDPDQPEPDPPLGDFAPPGIAPNPSTPHGGPDTPAPDPADPVPGPDQGEPIRQEPADDAGRDPGLASVI